MNTLSDIIERFYKTIFENSGSFYTKCRESEIIEFKKSLQVSGESISKGYLDTISGFANNKGGLIIFGVEPTNYEIIGIKEKYFDIDNRFATSVITEFIDGKIDFNLSTQIYHERIIGFLLVKKSIQRPVILKVNFDDNGKLLKIGEIYYRYSAITKRILSSDLRNIINEEVSNLTKTLFHQVNKIIKVGVDNTAILDKQSGELITGENQSVKFMLSKEILSELNLIQEGKIVEEDGSPAYIIKGAIDIENPTYIEKTVATSIRDSDIFLAFFKGKCEDPKMYIKELVYKDSPYYPVYFFIHQSNMSIEETIKYIKDINDIEVKRYTKSKLIKRLKDNYFKELNSVILHNLKEFEINFKINITEQLENVLEINNIRGINRTKSVVRTYVYNILLKKVEINKILYNDYFKEVLEAFYSLPKEFIISEKLFLLEQLEKIFISSTIPDKTVFRKVICKFDSIIYNVK